MLRSYRKGFDQEDIIRTAKLLTEAEIHFANDQARFSAPMN